MNKKLLLLFLFVIFAYSVNAQSLPGCCTEFTHNDDKIYCSETDSANCEGTFFNGLCSGLSVFDEGASACDTVFCESEDFSGSISRIACNDLGGEIIDRTTDSESFDEQVVQSVERGGCVVEGNCLEFTTRSACESIVENYGGLGVNGNDFDENVNSRSQCKGFSDVRNFNQLGCCVETNSCSRTFSDVCNGNFGLGNRCDNNAQCNNCGTTVRTCESDPSGYYIKETSGCGVENIRKLANDMACEQIGSSIVEFSTKCTVGLGTVREIELLKGFLINDKQTTITRDFLGGSHERMEGDSWCYASGDGENPGDSHFVLTCDRGNVVIGESCGLYRDKICEVEGNVPKCVDNKWEKCMACGAGEGWTGGCNKNECYNQGLPNELKSLSKSVKKDLSHCVYDDNLKNECWPKYPPGYEFWLDDEVATENFVSGESTRRCDGAHNNRGCGEGGDARLNTCDRNECTQLGDCSYDPGHPYIGAYVGGNIGAAVAAIGVTYLGPAVSGGYDKVIALFGSGAAEAGAAGAAGAGTGGAAATGGGISISSFLAGAGKAKLAELSLSELNNLYGSMGDDDPGRDSVAKERDKRLAERSHYVM